MFARLIAKHPNQPAGEYFDFRDVYRVAKVTFSGHHLLDSEPEDAWLAVLGAAWQAFGMRPGAMARSGRARPAASGPQL
jgi:hypothetical protein